MEPLSYFGNFVQKVKVPCFTDSFFQWTTQKLDGSCRVTGDSQHLYKLSKTQPLSFCKHIWKKYILWVNRTVLLATMTKCDSYPIFRSHSILIGNIKQLLQKLHAFCSNYQHVDCQYTFFKYRLSGKIVVKSGQLFDDLQTAVRFNQQNRGLDRMPSIAKKGLLRKRYKYQKHLLSSFRKAKSTQTSASVFADRIEQVKKTKIELELIETLDCFLDGHGNYFSELIAFKKIFVNWPFFEFQRDL